MYIGFGQADGWHLASFLKSDIWFSSLLLGPDFGHRLIALTYTRFIHSIGARSIKRRQNHVNALPNDLINLSERGNLHIIGRSCGGSGAEGSLITHALLSHTDKQGLSFQISGDEVAKC